MPVTPGPVTTAAPPAVQPPLLRGVATPAPAQRAPMQTATARPAMLQPAPQRLAPEPEAHPMPEAMQAPATARPIVIDENPPHTPRGVPPHLHQPLKPQIDTAPQRRSLFNLVTGAFRNSQPAVAPQEVAEASSARVEPMLHDPIERSQASVRPAVGDEIGLDIPAFLRRQTS